MVKTAYNSYRKWRSFRRTVNELNGLSDSNLADIGIIRSDISRVARQSSRGRG